MNFSRRPVYALSYSVTIVRSRTSRLPDISGFLCDTASAVSQHRLTGLAEPARGVSDKLLQQGSWIASPVKSVYDTGWGVLIVLDGCRYGLFAASGIECHTEYDFITRGSLTTSQTLRLNPRSKPRLEALGDR